MKYYILIITIPILSIIYLLFKNSYKDILKKIITIFGYIFIIGILINITEYLITK